MRTTMLMAAFGALLLSGCGDKEPQANAVPEANLTNAVTGENDADTVSAMNDGTRRLTFARALAAADLKCDGVVKAETIGEDRGVPLWRADCKNGQKYMLSVTPDGTVNIVSRSDTGR